MPHSTRIAKHSLDSSQFVMVRTTSSSFNDENIIVVALHLIHSVTHATTTTTTMTTTTTKSSTALYHAVKQCYFPQHNLTQPTYTHTSTLLLLSCSFTQTVTYHYSMMIRHQATTCHHLPPSYLTDIHQPKLASWWVVL
jgi:hypothetical protein